MGKKSWDLHSLPGGLFEMVCSEILFTGVQSNVQMDQEGHKILKIVMTRRLEGKPDNHFYTADCWQRVSSTSDTMLTSSHP